MSSPSEPGTGTPSHTLCLHRDPLSPTQTPFESRHPVFCPNWVDASSQSHRPSEGPPSLEAVSRPPSIRPLLPPSLSSVPDTFPAHDLASGTDVTSADCGPLGPKCRPKVWEGVETGGDGLLPSRREPPLYNPFTYCLHSSTPGLSGSVRVGPAQLTSPGDPLRLSPRSPVLDYGDENQVVLPLLEAGVSSPLRHSRRAHGPCYIRFHPVPVDVLPPSPVWFCRGPFPSPTVQDPRGLRSSLKGGFTD